MIIAPVDPGLQVGSVKGLMKFIWFKIARNLVELVD
jgi:hypothetical protein